MRKILFMLMAGVHFIACNPKTNTRKSSDLVQQNLHGDVQQLEETSYVLDSSGNKKIDSSVRIIVFDKAGYATRYMNKNASGKITFDEAAIHYNNGAIKEFLNKVDGKQISKMSIEIDNDGNYASVKTYDSSNKQDSYYTDIRENDYGIVYGAKQHSMNGKIQSGFDLKYDKANLIGGSYTDSLGIESYSFVNKLNSKGDPVEQTSITYENGSPKNETVTYKYQSYDEQGNWTFCTTYSDKGRATKIVKRDFIFYK